MPKQLKENERIHGFTYLRAILSFMILAWHAHFLGETPILTARKSYYPNPADVYQMNIVQIGVPLFIVMSLYLYVRKRELNGGFSRKYFTKRLLYFTILYIVWRSLFAVFKIGSFWIPERGLIRNIYHLIFGADTALYFFVELILFLIVTEIVCRIIEKVNNKLLVLFILLFFSLVVTMSLYLMPLGIKMESLRYFSPVGFIPYPFLTLILFYFHNTYDKKQQKHAMIISSSLSVIFIAFDWLFLTDSEYLTNGFGAAMSGYGRLSVVTLSFTVALIFLNIKKQPGKIIDFLSKTALYVFCLHPIFIKVLGSIENRFIFCSLVLVLTYICAALIYMIKAVVKKGFSDFRAQKGC